MSESKSPAAAPLSPTVAKFLDTIEKEGFDEQSSAETLRSLSATDATSVLRELADAYRQQASLLEIAEAVGSQLGLVPLIERVLEQMTGLLDADRASLYLVDKQRQELWTKVAQGMGVQEIRVPMASGIAGQVARTGQAKNVADAYQDPLFNQEIDQKTGYRTKSVLSVPIRDDRSEVIGVISAFNSKNGTFSAEDERALTRASNVLGLALRNSILYEAVVNRQKEVSTLLEVGASLSGTLELAELIQIIMKKARQITDAERSTLFLLDPETGELVSKVAEGQSGEIRVPKGQGIAGQVAATGKLLNIPDAYANPLFNQDVDQKTGFRTRNIVCVPMRTGEGQMIGVTQVINKKAGPFTEADERILTSLSSQAAVALDNSQLYERVRAMQAYLQSIQDSLSERRRDHRRQAAGHDRQPLRPGRAGHAGVRPRRQGLAPHVVQGQRRPARDGPAGPGLGDQHPAVRRRLPDARRQVRLDEPERGAAGRPQGPEDGRGAGAGRHHQREAGQEQPQPLHVEGRRGAAPHRRGQPGPGRRAPGSQHPLLGHPLLHDPHREPGRPRDRGHAERVLQLHGRRDLRAPGNPGQVHRRRDHGRLRSALLAADQDPVNAVSAGLDMMKELDRYNQERVARGQMAIDAGVGISSGEVVCGNIGSEKRMDYTVIGDGVNLASRLEGATKMYAAHLMISEFTHAKTGGKFVTRELDTIQVKGKTQGVGIHEVFARAGDPVSDDLKRRLETYDKAQQLYKGRKWQDALKAFTAGREAYPKDKVFGLYTDRCEYFIANPPADDWNGVWVLKDK